MFQRLASEQAFGIDGGQPTTVFGDTDGDDLVLILIDGFENRSGGKQRDFVLAAAAAEKYAHSEFLHHSLV